jgi:Big-like domain-containing protein
MRINVAAALSALAAAHALPATAAAAVSAGQPFPSDLFTIRDRTQATGLRVNLPKPDCAVRPSDCADVDVLNELDGLNIQPRISIPFSGPIDVSTVSSSTVFLVGPAGTTVGVQIVWDAAARSVHVESDAQLEEATTYLLVVTRGVRGADSVPLRALSLRRDHDADDDDGDDDDGDEEGEYWEDLRDALHMARARGVKRRDVAAASLFTTQSIRAISRKIRRQLRGPEPNFVLGTGGERTVFPLATVSSITWRRQISTAPAFSTGGLGLPPVTLPLGGRGIDLDGNTTIDATKTSSRRLRSR